jgi:hypothetical protein
VLKVALPPVTSKALNESGWGLLNSILPPETTVLPETL